jgi:glycerophosphoryl diester phosphodiesterase
MSFNPNSVERMAELAPDLPRGITTSAFDAEFWPNLPPRVRDSLRDIPDFGSVGAAFISHQAGDLERPRVQELRARGVPVLCWTIRSPAEERAARRRADNITFEGYTPALPA